VLAAGSYTFALSPAAEQPAPYALQAASQGTRIAGQELEPNDEENRAEPLRFGEPRVGLLTMTRTVRSPR